MVLKVKILLVQRRDKKKITSDAFNLFEPKFILRYEKSLQAKKIKNRCKFYKKNSFF